MSTIPLPDEAELAEVVEEILDELAEALGHPPIQGGAASDNQLYEAMVTMNADDFLLEFTIRLAEPSAFGLGAAMLHMQADEMEAEDISDAVGEVANLLGGGVKSLFDEETFLGVPVPARIDASIGEPGFVRVDHEFGTFAVKLSEGSAT